MRSDQIAPRRSAPAPMPGNNRTAGILSLLDAAATLGGKYKKMSDYIADEAKVAKPGALWDEFRAFRDPMGAWNLDLGNLSAGRPLNRYGSLGDLQDNAPSLREYLDGTEIADELGPQLSKYAVGKAPLPGYDAGVLSPNTQMGRPVRGLLALGAHHADPVQEGRLFEHEFQHVLQGITDAPMGTNADIAGDQMDYLAAIGRLPPDIQARMAAAAKRTGYSVADQSYLNSFGETTARLAEGRADPNVAPAFGDYVNAGGYRTDPNLWWQFRDSDELPMRDWWRKRWQK